MSTPVQLGQALSIRTRALGPRGVAICAVYLQTMTGLRGPLKCWHVALGQAGVRALPACAGRLLYTPSAVGGRGSALPADIDRMASYSTKAYRSGSRRLLKCHA
jgi:hypothetical protein